MYNLQLLADFQKFYFDNVFNDSLFFLYVVVVIVDIITGNLVALKLKSWNSKTGLSGTIKHIGIFSIVVILLPVINFVTEMQVLGNGVLAYIISQYTISVLENASVFGFELNESFTKFFKYLDHFDSHKKQDDKNGERGEKYNE